MVTMVKLSTALASFALVSLAAPLTQEATAQATAMPTVAVMYFNNGSTVTPADYEPLRVGLADILITELSANPRITVVERDALQKILEEQNLVKEQRVDAESAVRLGKILGAQHMILGGFVIDRAGRMRIDARAVNVETSKIEHVETATGRADDIFDLFGTLAKKLNDGLKLPARPAAAPRPPEPSRPAGETKTTAKVNPFKAMQTYARAVTAENEKDRATAVALYKQFLEEAPVAVSVAHREKAEARIKVLSAGTN
jgi:TolB-like protein